MKLRHAMVVLAGAAVALAPSVTADAGGNDWHSGRGGGHHWWSPWKWWHGPKDEAPSTFAVIGDIPYGDLQIANFPYVVDQINDDPAVDWVAHLGDIKSGSSECTDEYFDWVRSEFDRFEDALVYTPGDNEWTDCHRTNNGAYNPYERLHAIRDTFFPVRNRTLGQNPMRVTSQWNRGLIENVRFRQGDASFAALHVVGSNNGLAPWTGETDANWYQRLEVAVRTHSTLQLIDQTFDNARKERSGLVVLMMQADMFDPSVTDPSIDDLSAFAPIVRRIAHNARKFDGEVLLLDGDSHTWNEDRPLARGSSWPSFYGAKPANNLTRITVEGAGSVDEYLRVTVDDGEYSYERVPFAPTPITGVKINEVESQGGDPDDWVELVNLGPVAADVSGFVISDDDDSHTYALPVGTVIPSGGYLAVDSDETTGFDFGLGGSDAVRLYAPGGTTLLDSTTWDGHAASTWGRCPDGTGAFAVTGATTKGAANDCSPRIGINEVESSGGDPGDWVELYNPGPNTADLSGWTFSDGDDTHAYTIPAGTTVAAGEYVVLDADVFGFGLGGADSARLFSADGTLHDAYSWTSHATVTYGRCPNWVGPFEDTFASTKGAANVCGAPVDTIRINETESSGGDPGDWIEFVNIGTDDVDLGGWQFRDDDDTHTYDFPLGSVVPAGGFFVIEEDTDFDFGFGSTDTARLFRPDGTLADSYTQPAHAEVTWGRCPDGTGDFVDTGSPTKGAANDCAAPVVDTVKINEVESSGGTPGDWVELVNVDDAPVDISGWSFLDDDDNHTPYVLPSGTVIDAGGFVVIDTGTPGGFDFGLGGADTARLFRLDGSLADTYGWTEHAATTYGRCPDGTGDFTTTASPTKGSANDCPIPDVVVNEVESNGDATDWFELYNTGAAPVDLSGFSFLDNDDSKMPFVFPAGSVIAPGAFLVVENVGPPTGFDFGLGGADSVRLFDTTGGLYTEYTWTEHATTTYGRCPDGAGPWATTLAATKGGPNECGSPIVINEVESSGSTPDFIEVFNPTGEPVDVAGYTLSDDDDTHVYTFPAGMVIDPLEYVVVADDGTATGLGFGLGSGDSARLFDPAGGLVDSYAWTAHATQTYGRCPDGSGDFADTLEPTPGGQNRCEGIAFYVPWPGGGAVAAVDEAGTFSGDLSGLAYEPSGSSAAGMLWAVENGNGLLFSLDWNGAAWVPTSGWEGGKTLTYPSGAGTVDAEGVTIAGDATTVYVGAERDNTASSVSRNSVLAFDTSNTAATLVAAMEWDLTSDLPATGANAGIEAMAWIPDAFLTGNGFVDETTGTVYDPANYPGHGSGVFFVGVEATGGVYAYVLIDDGSFTRIATIDSGFPSVMALEFDGGLGELWAVCDDGCQGRSAVLTVDGGAFTVAESFERPAGMDNLNNEGFAIAPLAECSADVRPAIWADDGDTAGQSLRQGTVSCL